MSDKEWFSGLTFDDVIGKHVRIQMKDHSIIEGRLNSENGAVVTCDGGLVVFELSNTIFCPYRLNINIESISLVWDERDWEQIDLKNAGKGDVVVINGGLYLITDVRAVDDDSKPFFWSIGSNGCAVTDDMVSCALHSKHDFPTESGFYQSKSKETLYLSNDGSWWWFSEGRLFSMTQSPADFLPLTPVHFVDGKEQGNE